jgi:hypothetical protein
VRQIPPLDFFTAAFIVLIPITVKNKTLFVTTDVRGAAEPELRRLAEPVQSYDTVYLWGKEG